MNLSKDSWLLEHKKHCLDLSLEIDFVKSNIIKVSQNHENLINIFNSKIHNIDEEIKKIIIKKLKLRLSGVKNLSLLCSGGEDSIYLLLLLVKELKLKPKLLCYNSKNNLSDIKRLKYISNDLGLELYLYNKSNLNLFDAYTKFCHFQKRPPNDLAQPVHNALYFDAIKTHNSDIVIDGQFCDTVLLSNPQNHFIYWKENNSFILNVLVKILNLFPFNKESKLKSRLNYLQDLLKCSSSADYIFKLINLNDHDDDLKVHTETLIKQYGNQLTFSIYFFYCLLEIRERDKYLLCPKLFSPFDDFTLAFLANSNINQIIGFFTRKKPIRNLCRLYYPKQFRFQSTLPFEIE